MTPITTVVRVIDEQASLDHVERYRSRRAGLHFEHYEFRELDRTSNQITVLGVLLAALIVFGAAILGAAL